MTLTRHLYFIAVIVAIAEALGSHMVPSSFRPQSGDQAGSMTALKLAPDSMAKPSVRTILRPALKVTSAPVATVVLLPAVSRSHASTAVVEV